MIISEESSSKTINLTVSNTEYLVHYNDLGTGTETIVMLHGSGPGATSWANFSRNIEPLLNKGYRVILMDCPGWGKSSPVICTGLRSFFNANILLALLNELQLEQVHLMGNSMGAHSVIAFALENPNRIKKLILMGGGTGGPSNFTPMPAEGIKLLQQLYREPSIDNLKKMMQVFVYDSSNLTEELFKSRLNNMLAQQTHLDNFVASLAANPKQFPDVSPRLHEIQAPVLIIWGRDDRFVPMDTGFRLLANLPNAELHIFSRCGHWAQWEHATRFNQLTLDFLDAQLAE